MRARVIAVGVVAIAALGIGLWRPWRAAEPAPEDESTPADTNAGVAEAPPAPAPAAAPPASDAGPMPAPAARLPVVRLPPRDAAVASRDAGDENRARFRALHQAMANATPDAARLYANFARLRVVAPAEAMTLVEMKQRGVPQEQLVAYVKENFHDLASRAIALRWLGVAGGAAVGQAPPPIPGQPSAAPTSDPLRATGTLTRTDGG
jgi:hypothetical protein